jgi:WXG100 family type VII secretion target
MAYKIQIQYDDMENIASMFDNFADSTQEHIGKIEQLKGQVEGGGWVGVGSGKFIDELEGEVLPQLKILQSGYETAAAQVRKISQMFEEAEQTILSYFASL